MIFSSRLRWQWRLHENSLKIEFIVVSNKELIYLSADFGPSLLFISKVFADQWSVLLLTCNYISQAILGHCTYPGNLGIVTSKISTCLD